MARVLWAVLAMLLVRDQAEELAPTEMVLVSTSEVEAGVMEEKAEMESSGPVELKMIH